MTKNILPDVQKAYDIANALNISIEYLLTGKEENKKDKMKSKLKEMRNNLNDLESMI